MSKRDIPAHLYVLPLHPESTDTQTAELLGTVAGLPAPTTGDIVSAPLKLDWYWQPTALDISVDGTLAVILTYRGAYFFRRQPRQSWTAVFPSGSE